MKIVADNRGIGIANSRITVSTVGVVPAIERYTKEGLPFNLAVSFHATTDEERSALILLNQRWQLAAPIQRAAGAESSLAGPDRWEE